MERVKIKEFIKVTAWVVGIFAGLIAIVTYFSSEDDSFDLSGKWELTFKVEKSELKRFNNNNLEYKYKIFLTQNMNNVKGNGEKYWEKFKGKETFYNSLQKTPIEINGKILKNKLTVNIKERGVKRETSGFIQLELDEESSIYKGKFKTTAANSIGIAILEKTKD